MQCVLVIDDDAEICDFIRAALEADGYEVEVTTNATEGQKVLKKRKVDVILTDVFMPDKDGLQLIRELSTVEPRPKIVAMSAGLMRDCYDPLPEARLMGAIGILHKPFLVPTLLETVKRAIEDDLKLEG